MNKLKDLNDKFKEEELLKVDGNPQNKIVNVKKFSISKVIRPVIIDNVIFYEVKWKGYKETTIEPRDVLLKDVPKVINQHEKKNKLKFYVNTNKKNGEKTQRYHKGLPFNL